MNNKPLSQEESSQQLEQTEEPQGKFPARILSQSLRKHQESFSSLGQALGHVDKLLASKHDLSSYRGDEDSGSDKASLSGSHDESEAESFFSALSDAVSPRLESGTAPLIGQNLVTETLNVSGDLEQPIVSKQPPINFLLPLDTKERDVSSHIARRNSRFSVDLRIDTDIESKSDSNTLEQTGFGSPSLTYLDIGDRIPVDKLRAWIFGFVVLDFDLEVGQSIDFVYPARTELTEIEKSNIRYSSFPDNSSLVGDSVYSYRFAASDLVKNQIRSAATVHDAGLDYLYGFVFFRQSKDGRFKRGFLQKSLVILTHLPYPGLFLRVASILGSVYFNSIYSKNVSEMPSEGSTDFKILLESASHIISQWPSPEPGMILELPFLGLILQVELPFHSGDCNNHRAQLLESSSFLTGSRERRTLETPRNHGVINEQILASIPCTLIFPSGFLAFCPSDAFKPSTSASVPSPYCDISLLSTDKNPDLPGSSLGFFLRFYDNLNYLSILWELVLLGEPIVVIGKSQCVVSECVWWLTRIISPIPFAGDFRPYFTIQDADFAKFTTLFKGNSARRQGAVYQSSSAASSQVAIHGNISQIHSKSTPQSPVCESDSGAFLRGGAKERMIYNHRAMSTIAFQNRLAEASYSRPSSRAQSPTIQHSDPLPLIIGVTNQFFDKALEDWPHVLRVRGHRIGQGSKKLSSLSSPVNSPSYFRKNPVFPGSKSHMETLSGLRTNHRSFLNKDKDLIRMLTKLYEENVEPPPVSAVKEISSSISSFFSGSSSSSSHTNTGSSLDSALSKLSSNSTQALSNQKKFKGYVMNEILRRSFVNLTERFLAPLNRYFLSLIPTPTVFGDSLPLKLRMNDITIPFSSPPPLSAFKTHDFDWNAFMIQLEAHGQPQLHFKAHSDQTWLDLYARFIKSPNFHAWLYEKKIFAQEIIRAQFIEMVVNAPLEGDLVALFITLRRELLWTGYDPVTQKQDYHFRNTQSNENDDKLVASQVQQEEMITKADKIWQSGLSSSVRQAFETGLFDHFNCHLDELRREAQK